MAGRPARSAWPAGPATDLRSGGPRPGWRRGPPRRSRASRYSSRVLKKRRLDGDSAPTRAAPGRHTTFCGVPAPLNSHHVRLEVDELVGERLQLARAEVGAGVRVRSETPSVEAARKMSRGATRPRAQVESAGPRQIELTGIRGRFSKLCGGRHGLRPASCRAAGGPVRSRRILRRRQRRLAWWSPRGRRPPRIRRAGWSRA